MSIDVQCSISRPSRSRKMSMNSSSTRFPVGGRSQSSPRCVPPEGLAGRHEIALGELVVDFYGGIGKALEQRAVKGLESARGPVRLRDSTAFRPVVVLEFRVESLVGERQVVLVLAALYELGHRMLIGVMLIGVMLAIGTLAIVMLVIGTLVIGTLVAVARHPPPPASGTHHASSPVTSARTPLPGHRGRGRRSARRPGAELVGVPYGPDVLDPVTVDVEREHRHGDAVLLSHQAGLAVDRALQDRHVAGGPFG